MADINERLREAAKAGTEAELKAFRQKPGCEAFSQDKNGITALMWAALYGHEECVRLLLPVSNALAQNEDGLTASTLARNDGHESLAQFIEAYIPARSELASIGSASRLGARGGRARLRV